MDACEMRDFRIYLNILYRVRSGLMSTRRHPDGRAECNLDN